MSMSAGNFNPDDARKMYDKYHINGSHATWDPVTDNWMSVELYRVMHDGNLPDPDDVSFDYVLDFLDDIELQKQLMQTREDFGSLYLTAKRMIYQRYSSVLPIQPPLPRPSRNPSYPKTVHKKKVKKNGKRR